MKNNRVQIEKFTDEKSVQSDYKVLIYGNYTYRKNLELVRFKRDIAEGG